MLLYFELGRSDHLHKFLPLLVTSVNALVLRIVHHSRLVDEPCENLVLVLQLVKFASKETACEEFSVLVKNSKLNPEQVVRNTHHVCSSRSSLL